jgi:transcriptional regulator with XRE-family HTH domain
MSRGVCVSSNYEKNMSENRKVIGERIKEMREKYGYGRKELSVKLGFSRNLIGHWERGVSSPQPYTLVEISKIFYTTVDYLTGKTNDPSGSINEVVVIDAILNKEWVYNGVKITEERKIKLFNILKNALDLTQ